MVLIAYCAVQPDAIMVHPGYHKPTTGTKFTPVQREIRDKM
jgi:hypothetical protein